MTFQHTNTLAVPNRSDGGSFNGEVVNLKRGMFDEKTLGSTNMKPEQMNPSKKVFSFKPCKHISFHVNFPVCISWNPKKIQISRTRTFVIFHTFVT